MLHNILEAALVHGISLLKFASKTITHYIRSTSSEDRLTVWVTVQSVLMAATQVTPHRGSLMPVTARTSTITKSITLVALSLYHSPIEALPIRSEMLNLTARNRYSGKV